MMRAQGDLGGWRGGMVIGWLACAAFLMGCGGAPAGPKTYVVKGDARFAGQPIPVGTVEFVPVESTKGTSAFGKIAQGKYVTVPNQGVQGGKYRVVVMGFDGKPISNSEGKEERGTLMFPAYEMTADLPSKDSDFAIDVPESAAQVGGASGS